MQAYSSAHPGSAFGISKSASKDKYGTIDSCVKVIVSLVRGLLGSQALSGDIIKLTLAVEASARIVVSSLNLKK